MPTIIPLPPVPGVVKINIQGSASGGMIWENVFHQAYGGTPPPAADLDGYAGTVYSNFWNEFKGICSADTSIEQVTVTDLSGPMAGEGTHVEHQAGTSSGAKMGANIACLVSKHIVRRYRGGRPRSYLFVGTQVNLQDESHWNDAFVAVVLSAYETWIAALVGVGLGAATMAEECCVSYFGHSGPVGSPDYFPGTTKRLVPIVTDIPLDGYTVQKQLASQRGRIGRRV